MFSGKARSLSKKPREKHFTRTGSDLAHKNENRLEMLDKDKHPTLSGQFVSYKLKKYYNNGILCLYYKTFLFVTDK